MAFNILQLLVFFQPIPKHLFRVQIRKQLWVKEFRHIHGSHQLRRPAVDVMRKEEHPVVFFFINLKPTRPCANHQHDGLVIRGGRRIVGRIHIWRRYLYDILRILCHHGFGLNLHIGRILKHIVRP